MRNVTIATPFFNEEKSLNLFFETLNKIINEFPKGIELSLLWIDDGSSDETLNRLIEEKKKIKNISIKILSHNKNYGYGRTLYNSILNCETEFLITYDADCTYDYRLIFNLVEDAIQYKADVISVSYKLLKKKMNLSKFRNFLADASLFLYRELFKSLKEKNLTYYNCSFRIYRHSSIEKISLLSDDFNACSELLVKCSMEKLKILEIPGENIGRRIGKSNMKIFKNILNHIFMILILKLNFIKFKLKKNNNYEIY